MSDRRQNRLREEMRQRTRTSVETKAIEHVRFIKKLAYLIKGKFYPDKVPFAYLQIASWSSIIH